VRGGFFNPSLDGGFPLFPLFNPSRRSNSARRAVNIAISAAWRLSCAIISAMSSSFDSRSSRSRFIESLNRNPYPMSKI
jgi:hypothetical protein